MGQKLAKTELFAHWLGGTLVLADQGLSTGRRIWVHSATGTDAGGYGANPDAPLATLDEAVGLCTDNKGDIIYVMPGHSEDLAAAGELADLDKDGIIIQGLGVGADRPTFTLSHADAQITVDGASITIHNIHVASAVADCVQALDVGGGADGLTIDECEFEDGGSDITELIDAIKIATGCNDVTIRNSRFLTQEGGTITSAITFEGTHDNCRIEGNYINGDHGTAGIVGTAGTGTRLLIANNWIKTKDGEPGIELKSDTTGVISDNRIETSGMGDPDLAIVAADCSWFRNFANVTDGKADELIGAIETGSVEGKVDSVGTLVSTADSKVVSAHVITDSKVVSAHVVTDSTAVSAHVVTDAALSVADSKVVSAHVVTDSKVVSAHVVTDSTAVSAHVVTDAAISVADSKIVSAHVVTDAAISVADSKVVSTHVVTDSKVISAHVVSDAAISVADSKVVSAHVITDSKVVSAHVVTDSTAVSAHVVTDAAISVADSKVVSAHVITDSKVVSAHVATDADIAVIESWDVRTVKKAGMTLDGGTQVDTFAVANGPIELIGLVCTLTEAVSANACAFKWQSDPTIGAGQADLCGTVDVNGFQIGDHISITGTSGDAAVRGANGTAVGNMCSNSAIVMPGGIDAVFADASPTSGIADVYLVYRPLSSTAVVTAP